VELTLGAAQAAFEARLAAFDAARFVPRLWARDDTLWSEDPTHRAVARNRLGWLDAAAAMRPSVPLLQAFAAEVAREGFTHAVLLGMGGSSLAPETLRLTFGVASGALELTVLDNTSPAAVRAVAAARDPRTTLFIVSSKSGGTIEVASFERYFHDWSRAALREGAGRAFVAITDPGSPLERLAGERGYRRVFHGAPDIGGRYSALSPFGLVPGALIGADLGALLDAASAEARASGPDVPPAANPAVRLGTALGVLALAGRDKVTLVLGEEVAPLGGWIEQLIAESTGKDGQGILPVADETLGPPAVYGPDRVFVAVSARPPPASTASALGALAAAGHPVLRWTLPGLSALGGEFLRWEIATATAGATIGVDPFDEPNVTEAKQATQAALAEFLAAGKFPDAYALAKRDGLEIEAPTSVADALEARIASPRDPAAWAAALPAMARGGDYLALCAYLHRTPARQERLQRLRLALRATSRLATTLGYGPRFLHSTGQLHKGGPNSGLFLQLTADEGDELPIPGERYGFGALRRAQAAGDYEVLERRRRRVMRVHLGREVEAGLDRLIAAVEAGKA
jgi:glucose-6-phosphate isomerase